MTLSLRAALALIAGLLLAQSAHAFHYEYDKPMMFFYQNKTNYWFACGPIQCTSAGNRNKTETLDRVSHDSHGNFETIGYYGRCTVLQGDGELESYDLQTERIIKLMKDRCSQQ
jgi:hypothetical protein